MSKVQNEKYSVFLYFNYFKKLVGNKVYIYIILNFLVGLLDGLGLAMFIPLLSIATKTDTGKESLGNLKFFIEFINKIGVELNLTNALLVIILLFILKGFFYYIRSIFFIRIRLNAIEKIRLKLVDGLRRMSYHGFTKMDVGKIQNSMLGETGRLISCMVQYFISIQHIILLTTYVILAFFSNWKFAIMVGVGGLLTNVFYKYINKVTKEYSKKLTNVGHSFNGNLVQSIQNFKYLKATNYFKKYTVKLKQDIKESEYYTFNVGKIAAIAESLREPMIIIIISIVILIQVNVLKVNFGTILVSLLLFYRALAHLVSMQNAWNNFMSNSAALDSIEFLLKDFKDHEEKIFQNKIEKIDNIKVNNVSVNFGSKKVLDHINFNIPRKSSIALVGESGAGKTTLANVICGLQPAHEGKIIVDNQNIYESDLDNLREKIGYITQEPVIFNDSIFNNITFWDEKTTENLKKFNDVLELVSLRKFVDDLDQKENTPLGNNGILISGGQKQRISIARELYKDVELLIMDEATSALDSETEKHIKDNIDLLQGKYTMVIIAHRLSTIKNVDMIYILENGKIIDSGKYYELTEKSEKFKKMVNLQDV